VKTRAAASRKNQASRNFKEVGVYGEYQEKGYVCLADAGGRRVGETGLYGRARNICKNNKMNKSWVGER
jgi:hypothetical protein